MATGIALARRLEAAEGAGAAACANSEQEPAAATLDVAGGVAVYAGPGAPFNKAVGLGLKGPVPDAELDRLAAFFEERDESARVELCPLADAGLPAALAARGWLLEGFEQVLVRPLDTALPEPRATEPETEIADGEAELRDWARIVAAGFSVPEGHSSEETSFAGRPEELEAFVLASRTPGSFAWLARVEGKPVAGASLTVRDGIAALAGTATLPVARGRGAQAALLRARLAHGRDAGCHLAMTNTLPGSTSQRNAERAGFRVVYTRAILVRPAKS